MTSQRYIVKRIGDDFVVVRSDLSEVIRRVGPLALGSCLLRWGARRSGWSAVAAMLVGGALGWRGLTGTSIVDWIQQNRTDDANAEEHGPSYRHKPAKRSEQVPMDPVEEAVMESFPASDPPASQSQH